MDDQQTLPPAKDPYASRWLRLFGYLVDGIILSVIFAYIDMIFIASEFYVTIYGWCPNDNVYAYVYEFIAFVSASIVFLLLNVWLIYKRGQTVGKIVCGTVVVTKSFRQVSGNRYLLMRFIPYYLVASIPFFGSTVLFFDTIAIFRPEKNRLFDDWAQTRVVRRKSLKKYIKQERKNASRRQF